MTAPSYSSPFRLAPLTWGFVWLLLVATTTTGCFEENAGRDASIVRVVPALLQPGGTFTIEGYGLGLEGSIQIGGLPCSVESWEDRSIRAVVPASIGGGHTLLTAVLLEDGVLTHPVEIAGPPRRSADSQPPVVAMDGGGETRQDAQTSAPSDASVDGLISRDATSPADQTPDAPLTAEFSPDPVVNDAIRVTGRVDTPGFVFLTIFLGNDGAVGGIAFHLTYDSGLLAFEVADKEVGPRFQAKEIAPGRLAVGWVRSGRQGQSIELRFKLLGPGEGRIEFPARYRTVRDPSNQPFPDARWTTGSVRIRRGR